MRVWLKTLREGQGMTMKALAEKLDISESYYCAVENGTRQKKMDIILASGIAAVFNISVQQVIKMEDEYRAEIAS